MKIRLVWNDQRSKTIDARKDLDNKFIIPNKIVFAGEIFQFAEEDQSDPEIKIYKVYKNTTK